MKTRDKTYKQQLNKIQKEIKIANYLNSLNFRSTSNFAHHFFRAFNFRAHLFFAHPFKGKLKIKASYPT